MKTSELIGPALDWAVAVADGWEYENPETPADPNRLWKPSIKWGQGGPIIARERITITASGGGTTWMCENDSGYWIAPTPLIAAMRCFVASKLGDEVEIPEELC